MNIILCTLNPINVSKYELHNKLISTTIKPATDN